MKIAPYYFATAIRQAIPDAYKITRPEIRGGLDSVYIAESESRGKFICKFNHRDMAMKNAIVSELMRENNISVPAIKVFEYNDNWMEVYPMLPGQTLFQAVQNGMPEYRVMKVYREILRQFEKMSHIHAGEVPEYLKFRDIQHVVYSNVSDMTGPIAAPLFANAVRILNHGSRDARGLYHCGITPKNIIVSNRGHFVGLVDLDDAAVCNKNYAFGVMATQYGHMGCDADKLMANYEKQTGDTLHHGLIKQIGRVNNFGRWAMWKNSQHTK